MDDHYTTTAAATSSSAKPITIETLKAILDNMPPAPPPADPDWCIVCKFPLADHNRCPIYYRFGIEPMCYVCPGCLEWVKAKFAAPVDRTDPEVTHDPID